jgi:hypothetical protein
MQRTTRHGIDTATPICPRVQHDESGKVLGPNFPAVELN